MGFVTELKLHGEDACYNQAPFLCCIIIPSYLKLMFYYFYPPNFSKLLITFLRAKKSKPLFIYGICYVRPHAICGVLHIIPQVLIRMNWHKFVSHNEEMKAMVGYSSCYLENNHNHVRERVDCGPVRENRSAYYNEMSAMDGCATV